MVKVDIIYGKISIIEDPYIGDAFRMYMDLAT